MALAAPRRMNGGRAARCLLVACAAALQLCACGRVSGHGLPALATTTASACRPGARLPHGAGELVNNSWNAAAAGSAHWHQCVGLGTSADGHAVAWWDWHWPGRARAVYAYPGWLAGASPWLSAPGNDRRFPLALATTRQLWISHDAELRSTGAWDLAASAWLVRPVADGVPGERDIAAEVMVWTDYTPETVAHPEPTTLRTTFRDGAGHRWQLWAAQDWGDDSGGSRQRWTHLVFLLDRAQRSGHLRYDLIELLSHARPLGLVTPELQIADIEFGTELLGGEGRLLLREMRLDIVSEAVAGTR